MIDYKKAAKAAKLLKESGVSYVLSYDNGENCTAITSMHGDWLIYGGAGKGRGRRNI